MNLINTRNAVAFEFGWTLEQSNEVDGVCWHLYGIQAEEAPPEFCRDLNACASMIKTLKDNELIIFDKHLSEIPGVGFSWRATAYQLSIAFLKTKGKYV